MVAPGREYVVLGPVKRWPAIMCPLMNERSITALGVFSHPLHLTPSWRQWNGSIGRHDP
jgi:hypothetical protein